MKTLTKQMLQTLFIYDESSGEFRHKVTKSSNARAGDIAGSLNNLGYRETNINGTVYLVHRLIWLYKTGKFPDKTIDHKDCDRSNNKWENLREATREEQAANSLVRSESTTGFKGICLSTHRGYPIVVASISVGSKRYSKTRRYTNRTIQSCIDELLPWLEGKRKELHGEFANNG